MPHSKTIQPLWENIASRPGIIAANLLAGTVSRADMVRHKAPLSAARMIAPRMPTAPPTRPAQAQEVRSSSLMKCTAITARRAVFNVTSTWPNCSRPAL